MNKFRRFLAAETCVIMHYFGNNPNICQVLGLCPCPHCLSPPYLYSFTAFHLSV